MNKNTCSLQFKEIRCSTVNDLERRNSTSKISECQSQSQGIEMGISELKHPHGQQFGMKNCLCFGSADDDPGFVEKQEAYPEMTNHH
jgi:hypothetical protein